jgi:hypothetical protein
MRFRTGIERGSALAAALASRADMLSNRGFGFSAIQAAIDQSRKAGKKNIARSKYMPHQGPREIARRLRQAERDRR